MCSRHSPTAYGAGLREGRPRLGGRQLGRRIDDPVPHNPNGGSEGRGAQGFLCADEAVVASDRGHQGPIVAEIEQISDRQSWTEAIGNQCPRAIQTCIVCRLPTEFVHAGVRHGASEMAVCHQCRARKGPMPITENVLVMRVVSLCRALRGIAPIP